MTNRRVPEETGEVTAGPAKKGRAKLRRVARRMAGSLADVDIPGWDTKEAAAEWVRALRRLEDKRPG